MRTVRLEVLLGCLGTPALLAVLSRTPGLGAAGWAVGLVAGWTATVLMAVARLRSDEPEVHPADWVTLVRALLAAGVAGLVADSPGRPPAVTPLVALAAVALVLDGVDGQVARRTRTATALGGRFDGEVDAFLILALSVAASRDLGSWVLAIGLARYALLVAGWVLPWLAAPLPFRYWRKVVAAVQGVVLAVALTGALPRPATMAAVGVALVLLTESFGRDVVWLYRTGAGPRTRRALRLTTVLLAGAALWGVLVAPDQLDQLAPAAFARIPLEGLVLATAGLLLPRRTRRVVAALAGVAATVLAVDKVLDVGFHLQLGRRFDPVLDLGSLEPGIRVVRDSIGDARTNGLLAAVGLALLVLLVVLAAAAVHVTDAVARSRRRSARGIIVLAVAWAVCAALSLQLVPGAPVASASSAGLVAAQVRDARASLREQQRLREVLRAEPPADQAAAAPAGGMLAGLQGKDVLVVFVESYGEVALTEPSIAPGVDAVLRDSTAALDAAGWSARSGWLDSPTFGALSWLAHSTLQSGLRIADQQRYDQLMASDRLTLSGAFKQAGWRTVGFNPADDRPWDEGTSFYGYDQLYDEFDLGYRGPTFGFAKVPDQFSLDAFRRLELGPGHRPVMAEIDLATSHFPWTPVPRVLPWEQLGDGTVFDGVPAQSPSADEVFRSAKTVRQFYGRTVEYSLQALYSWAARLQDPDLVMVVLGDHQPHTVVTGPGASHRVPVTLVASDPAVVERTAPWGWQDGLRPDGNAPTWPMEDFRDRFLAAFYGVAP